MNAIVPYQGPDDQDQPLAAIGNGNNPQQQTTDRSAVTEMPAEM